MGDAGFYSDQNQSKHAQNIQHIEAHLAVQRVREATKSVGRLIDIYDDE